MPGDPTHHAREELRRECRIFTRYLTGRDPDEYVLEKYSSMQPAVRADATAHAAIDQALVRTASAGVFRARAADAYARIFRPRGLLRRKLILLFAILENSAAFHREFTSGGRGSLGHALIRVALSLLSFGLALAAGAVVFAPQHVWLASHTRDPGR